jgi:exosortase/archaeosortase family protein
VALALIFPLIIFLLPYFSLRQRIASLFFVPLLFMGNVFRIVIDVLIGVRFSTEMLIFFHDGIGQVFIFAWAIGCYIIWLSIFKNFPKEKLFKRPTILD